MPKMTVVIENRRLAAGRSIVSSFDVSTSPLIEIFHPFITSPSPSIDGGFYWPFGGPRGGAPLSSPPLGVVPAKHN